MWRLHYRNPSRSWENNTAEANITLSKLTGEGGGRLDRHWQKESSKLQSSKWGSQVGLKGLIWTELNVAVLGPAWKWSKPAQRHTAGISAVWLPDVYLWSGGEVWWYRLIWASYVPATSYRIDITDRTKTKNKFLSVVVVRVWNGTKYLPNVAGHTMECNVYAKW